MPRLRSLALASLVLVACGHKDAPSSTGGPGTALSAEDSCKAEYSPAKGYGYGSDGGFPTTPAAAGGAPAAPPDPLDQAVMQCMGTGGPVAEDGGAPVSMGSSDPTACERTRLMTRDAALCIAKADGLAAGIQPWTAAILFHSGYVRIVWIVTATTSVGPAPTGAGGDIMTIDAITGGILGRGQWGSVE